MSMVSHTYQINVDFLADNSDFLVHRYDFDLILSSFLL